MRAVHNRETYSIGRTYGLADVARHKLLQTMATIEYEHHGFYPVGHEDFAMLGAEGAADRRILDDRLNIFVFGRRFFLRDFGGNVDATEIGFVLIKYVTDASFRGHKDFERSLDAVGQIVDSLDVVGVDHGDG